MVWKPWVVWWPQDRELISTREDSGRNPLPGSVSFANSTASPGTASRVCIPRPLSCSWAALALPPSLPTSHLQCLSSPDSPCGNGDAPGLTQGRKPSGNPGAAEDTISLPWDRKEELPFLSEITPNERDQPPKHINKQIDHSLVRVCGIPVIQHLQNTDLLPWGLGQYLFSPSA